MNKRIIFAVVLVLLLAATTITFARNTVTATVSISASGETSGEVATTIVASAADADTSLKYSTGTAGSYVQNMPNWSPVIDEAGSITPGDVFLVDCGNYTGDVQVTLYLTNPNKLTKDYTFLNMQVNVWKDVTGVWTQSALADGSAIGTVYLTIHDGFVSFILTSHTKYCVSVDGGTYYCIDTDTVNGSLSPDFYIEVNPI